MGPWKDTWSSTWSNTDSHRIASGHALITPRTTGTFTSWFGVNAEGLPIVTPIGNLIGSLVFALGFGFAPGWVLGKVLSSLGMLRVSPEKELLGLDGKHVATTYPAHSGLEAEFEAIQRAEAKL